MRPRREDRPAALPISPLVVDPGRGCIRLSITNQHGRRYRYRARAVSLRMQKGVLQIMENNKGYFFWFEQGELELSNSRRTLLFRFNAGAASNSPGAELVILAELLSSGIKGKARGSKPSTHAKRVKRSPPPRRPRTKPISR